MERSYRDLVEDARRGDRDAREALLQEHLPGLLAFVRLRAGEEVRAQESSWDLVQSTCREILQKLPRFRVYRDEADFKRWLYVTVERKIKDRARYYRSRRPAAEARPARIEGEELPWLAEGYSGFFTPSDQASMREQLERVERAFARLSEKHRHVILQVRVLGRSYADLAQELDCNAQAVRTLTHRALARLATLAGLDR